MAGSIDRGGREGVVGGQRGRKGVVGVKGLGMVGSRE